MSTSEKPGMLIAPQGKPAETTNAAPKPGEAEEKSRLIDEALANYESHVHGPTSAAMVKPSVHATPDVESNPLATVEPMPPDPSYRAKEKEFIASHAEEIREALNKKLFRAEKEARHQKVAAEVIIPTDIDPDATVAAAVEEIRRRHEEEAARHAEHSQTAAFRYQSADRFIPVVQNKKMLITLAMVWLLAVPFSLGIYALISGADSIGAIVGMVLVYILGAYGALGWVPLVLFYIRNTKDW